MENIIKALTDNKVTVELKTNKLNEMYVLGDVREKEDKFAGFPDLVTEYRNRGPAALQQRPRNGVLHSTQVKPCAVPRAQPECAVPLQDPFMYIVASYVDNTLTLLKPEDINKKVSEFKQTLADNLTNTTDAYKKLKLKSIVKDVDVLKSEILSNDRTQYDTIGSYLSKLFKRNIIISKTGSVKQTFINVDTDDGYLEIGDRSFIIKETGFKDATIALVKQRFNIENKEKLKKLLVKDLKTIAGDLNIPTYKTIDNKKISLLKEELVEKISSVITTII
jgi:hypothetical protein